MVVLAKLKDIEAQLEIFGVEGMHVKGGNVIAKCPFHPDRNPSFGVHPKNGSFCFSCFTSFHTLEDLYAALSEKTGVGYERNEKLTLSEDDYERPPKEMNPRMLDQYEFDSDYFVENWGISHEIAKRRRLCLDPHTHVECFPIFDLDGIFWGMVERLPPTKNRRSFYRYPRDFKKSDILIGEDIQSDSVWLV